jgi:hypothetical protein
MDVHAVSKLSARVTGKTAPVIRRLMTRQVIISATPVTSFVGDPARVRPAGREVARRPLPSRSVRVPVAFSPPSLRLRKPMVAAVQRPARKPRSPQTTSIFLLLVSAKFRQGAKPLHRCGVTLWHREYIRRRRHSFL